MNLNMLTFESVRDERVGGRLYLSKIHVLRAVIAHESIHSELTRLDSNGYYGSNRRTLSTVDTADFSKSFIALCIPARRI